METTISYLGSLTIFRSMSSRDEKLDTCSLITHVHCIRNNEGPSGTSNPEIRTQHNHRIVIESNLGFGVTKTILLKEIDPKNLKNLTKVPGFVTGAAEA